MREEWQTISIYLKIRELAHLKRFVGANDIIAMGLKPKTAYYYLEELTQKKALVKPVLTNGRRGQTGKPKVFSWNSDFDEELGVDLSKVLTKQMVNWTEKEINFENWPDLLLRSGKLSLTVVIANSTRFYERSPRSYAKSSDALGILDLLSKPPFTTLGADIQAIHDDWALYSPTFKNRVSSTDIICIGGSKTNLLSRKLNDRSIFHFKYQLKPRTDFEFLTYPIYSIADPFVDGGEHVIGTGGLERHGLGLLTMCESPFDPKHYAIFVGGYRAFANQACLQILSGKWNGHAQLSTRPFGGVVEVKYEEEPISYNQELGTIKVFKINAVKWLTPSYTVSEAIAASKRGP